VSVPAIRFNLNRIHDSVGKALRTADQDHVTAISHALSSNDICTARNRTVVVQLKDKNMNQLLISFAISEPALKDFSFSS
jgi:hypothetical protein